MTRAALLPLAVALAACGPHKIPGTDLDDTSETRAILDMVTRYKTAVESRSAQGLLALADESFRDDGGSANPDDDLQYKDLASTLQGRFERLSDVRLDVAVRRIELDADARSARVTYSYTLTFKMPTLSSRSQSETDIKQMALKRVGERDWKIVSGI
jgi:hypothetical protein